MIGRTFPERSNVVAVDRRTGRLEGEEA